MVPVRAADLRAADLRAVDVYPYRQVGRRLAFLVLRRAAGTRYAGQWRMVGGKVEPGETAHAAARRELAEETGQAPLRFWTLPSVNTFYEWHADRLTLAPAFAAEMAADPVLDREHDAFRWLPPPAAAACLAWPEQQRLLLLAADLLERGAVLPEWEIPG